MLAWNKCEDEKNYWSHNKSPKALHPHLLKCFYLVFYHYFLLCSVLSRIKNLSNKQYNQFNRDKRRAFFSLNRVLFLRFHFPYNVQPDEDDNHGHPVLCIKSSLQKYDGHNRSDKNRASLQHLLSTSVHHSQCHIHQTNYKNVDESWYCKDVQRRFRQKCFIVVFVRFPLSMKFDGMQTETQELSKKHKEALNKRVIIETINDSSRTIGIGRAW